MMANHMPQPGCLTDEDFYSYLTQQGNGDRSTHLEAHLSKCSACQHALANLIELLHPEGEQEAALYSEPTNLEIEQTLNLIRSIPGKKHERRANVSPWLRWPVAAAAAIAFIAIALLGARYLQEINKSKLFLAQANNLVNQGYTGASPSHLRLALPFTEISTERKTTGTDSLRRAENLFFQALAIRENMIEPHLGLGYIYLRESKLDQARDEFQKVLNLQKGQSQALVGRGVAHFEEAAQSSNALERSTLLKDALSDFDAVLKNSPGAAEARYNKIWTLFESGLHTEAIQEIDLYLSRDSNSIWADALKNLKSKIQAARSSALEDAIDRAAQAKDTAALSELCRLMPGQIPAAIWSAMARSLQPSPTPAQDRKPGPDDLRWAAGILEASYAEVSGDRSFKDFIAFYDGLSPPQRQIKRSLDLEFQGLVKSYQGSQFDSVLLRSKPLETRYIQINDSWQRLNLHSLRGNSLYLGKADYGGAESEFLKMYRIADRLAAPEPTAKALAGLAMILGAQRKFDASLDYATQLRILARKYHFDFWQMYAAMTLGSQYRRLGQTKLALQEYNAALAVACRLSDVMRISEALENSGIAMERDGKLREAENLYLLAAQRQDSLLNSRASQPMPSLAVRRLNLLFQRADLASRTGAASKAEALFKEGLDTAGSGRRELSARNRIGLAEVYLRTGRTAEAEAMIDPAVAVGESGPYPEIEWKAKFLKGRVFENTGRNNEALSFFRQSIAVLEGMRRKVQTEDLKQSFMNDRFDPFQAIVSLFIKSADKQKALEFVDRAKAATLKEDLAPLHLPAQIPTGLVRSRYPAIEYFFTREGLVIFAVSDGRLEVEFQNVTSKELSRQLEEFLQSIQKNDSGEFSRMAQQLYNELIGPVEKFLFANNRPETLVILPDGPLHLMPFSGLMDRAGHFLIEKSPLAFASSRAVFNHCLLSRPKSHGADPHVALVDGTQSLPFAQEELRYLSNLYGKSAVVLGAKDSAGLKQRMESVEILHFSGHSILKEGKPVLVVQTLPTEICLDCKTIRAWKLPRLRLVNLSGCSTAVGPLAEGESPWGLIPAFLNAGAPAIIASLMAVDDESTRKLNGQFYSLLREGASTAKALQLAQIALLDSARRHSEIRPQSWIPYVLVGNPQ